ncbi:MAG: hypothetical protein IJX90_05355 [Blautia sp.]|nr:hypothetical protein [Blautia sp.]
MTGMIGYAAGFLLAAGYLVVFCLFGSLPGRKIHGNSLLNMVLLGFGLYFSGFQLVALPLKMIGSSLKILSLSWAGVCLAAMLIGAFFRRKEIAEAFGAFCGKLRTSPWLLLVLLLLLVIAVVLGFNIEHVSDLDAGYYLGLPTSSVYSNTIERMDPYTGVLLDAPQHYYLLNTYVNNSAVLFQLLGLHPALQEVFSMTMVFSTVFGLFLLKGGRLLFGDDDRKSFVFVLLSLLSLWFSFSIIAGVSHYFAYRTYEGKSITAYLCTAAIFVFAAAIVEGEKTWGYTGLFLTGVCGVCFSNSAIYVVPVMTAAFLVPSLLKEQSNEGDRLARRVLRGFLVLVPSMVWLLLHRFL